MLFPSTRQALPLSASASLSGRTRTLTLHKSQAGRVKLQARPDVADPHGNGCKQPLPDVLHHSCCSLFTAPQPRAAARRCLLRAPTYRQAPSWPDLAVRAPQLPPTGAAPVRSSASTARCGGHGAPSGAALAAGWAMAGGGGGAASATAAGQDRPGQDRTGDKCWRRPTRRERGSERDRERDVGHLRAPGVFQKFVRPASLLTPP